MMKRWLRHNDQLESFSDKIFNYNLMLIVIVAFVCSTYVMLNIRIIDKFNDTYVLSLIHILLMRFTEIVSSVPFMPLVITLSASLGNDLSTDQKMYLIMIILDVYKRQTRSMAEPEDDRVLRGSRDGFVETLVFNTALIRRRIRDTRLHLSLIHI